jgi:hypothetical protein
MRRMDAVKRRVSFAELQRMPDDGNRYKLYDGELHVVPSPLLRHQRVTVYVLDAGRFADPVRVTGILTSPHAASKAAARARSGTTARWQTCSRRSCHRGWRRISNA